MEKKDLTKDELNQLTVPEPDAFVAKFFNLGPMMKLYKNNLVVLLVICVAGINNAIAACEDYYSNFCNYAEIYNKETYEPGKVGLFDTRNCSLNHGDVTLAAAAEQMTLTKQQIIAQVNEHKTAVMEMNQTANDYPNKNFLNANLNFHSWLSCANEKALDLLGYNSATNNSRRASNTGQQTTTSKKDTSSNNKSPRKVTIGLNQHGCPTFFTKSSQPGRTKYNKLYPWTIISWKLTFENSKGQKFNRTGKTRVLIDVFEEQKDTIVIGGFRCDLGDRVIDSEFTWMDSEKNV